jgi:predicted AlkP superfamily phosphohydrolase/phosphomutase
MSEASVPPILIIGVSGATWDVLAALEKKGRVPNIHRLLKRGCGAALRSVKVAGDKHYRPQAAWASLATGCRPDRHGVTQFYHEAAELRAPTLWDIYSGQGLTSGIYGWPSTWPPPSIRGFVVPSHLARDDRTWPPDLRRIKALDREQQSLDRDGGAMRRLAGAASAVQTLVRYGVRTQTFAKLAKDAPAALFSDVEQRRLLLRKAKLEVSADMFVNLYKKHQPNLAAFVTFYVDFVSHRYWRFRSPPPSGETNLQDLRFRDAVDQSYADFDAIVGRLVQAAPKDSVIVIVSEHGMDPEPKSAEVGSWYFSIRGSRIHQLLRIDPGIQPHAMARWIAFRPVDADKIRSVSAKLKSLTIVETGLPLFRVHEHNQEVIIKFALDADVVRYAEGDLEKLTVRIGDRVAPFSEFARRSGRQRSAMHARDGVFLISGPGIRNGEWLSEASVLDVAPTLLRVAGLAVTTQMDGKSLNLFS